MNRWIYSGQLTPVAELDSAGNIASRFVGSYMIKGDSTYRIVRDHLGSVRLIVNTQTGAIAQRIDYDEFGNILTNTNSNFIPFGFAGGLYESQTELVRFGARDYAAKSGRWTSKDPIGFGGGVSNIYEYVVNDPIDLFDRTGLQIIVIENGPTQHNPIGHTAIAIAGAGVYSYGNNTPLGLSLVDYLTSQAPNRTTNVYVMQTTPEQDAAALKYLTSHTSPLGTSALDVLTDNCSTRSNNALDAAGIPRISELLQDRGVIDPPFDYISMPGYAGLRALLYGADVYSIPQGSTTIPFSLKKF